MKYQLEIAVTIRDPQNHMSNFSRHEDTVDLKNIGQAGELLVRIHQLIFTAQEQSKR